MWSGLMLLFSTAYDSGWGTLYTAVYHPVDGVVDYRWPTHTWRLGFGSYAQAEHTEVLAEPTTADSAG